MIPPELLWAQIKIIRTAENCGVRGQTRVLTTGHRYPGPETDKTCLSLSQGHEEHPSSGLGAYSDIIDTRLKHIDIYKERIGLNHGCG